MVKFETDIYPIQIQRIPKGLFPPYSGQPNFITCLHISHAKYLLSSHLLFSGHKQENQELISTYSNGRYMYIISSTKKREALCIYDILR